MPVRNLSVLIGVVVLIAVLIAIVVTSAGKGQRAPAAGAAAIVPGDALLYVHLSTDPSRPAVQSALSVARRFPDFPLGELALTSRLARILSGGASTSLDFATQVRPWLGKEAAFALLNTPTSTAGSLLVLSVRNRAKASAFIAAEGATPSGSYLGAPLLRYSSGTTAAFVRRYLVLGQAASVHAALNAAAGRVQSLSRSPQYRQAAAGEPSDRVLDAYLSVDGVRRVLAAQGGLLGALGVLLYEPALTGTTLALSPDSSGFRIRVHGALDPTLVRVSGPPSPSFSPSLAGVLPERTTLLLDVTGLKHVATRVLGAGAEGGIAGRIGPLLTRLAAALAAEGVNVAQITSIFSGESAVAVAPAGTSRSGRGPALVIVARTANEGATRRLLASLEVPLAQLFPAPASGPGQAPEFNTVPVAGVTAHELALAPGLQIDYAVFDNLVVVSTSVEAVGLVARHAHSLADESAFQATTGGSDRVTSLVFLDFSKLLTLAEQTGLGSSARIQALRPDLDKITAIGIRSTRGENDTTAELRLEIR